jgi:hypothetical protein
LSDESGRNTEKALTRTMDAMRQRARARPAVIWLVPVAVGLCLLIFPDKVIEDMTGGAIAVLVFAFLVSRPGQALIVLVVFLPLQLLGFALLLSLHVPGSILRPAGALSEILTLAVLFAGLRQLRDTRRRLDRIDIALLLYVAAVTLYLAFPHAFAAGAPTRWSLRLLAWRSDAGYPLLFFGARHAPIPQRLKDRFLTVVMGLGALIAVLALYQRLAPASWSSFVLNTAHLATYQLNVSGFQPYLIVQELEYLFFISPLRVSSIFASPFDMSDYLIVVVAIAAVRIRNNTGRPWVNYAVLAMSLGAIYFSRVRGDAIAVVVILILMALPGARRPREGRMRLVGVLCIGAILIVPSLGGSRYVGAAGGSSSTSAHITEIEQGLKLFVDRPLGLGLGSEPSDRQYLVVASTDTSEDAVLQVSNEIGIQSLLPWLAMMGFILLELRRRARDGDAFASIMGFALLGILIAGLTHHVFLVLPVPWTLWAGVGLALSTYRFSPSEPDNVLLTELAPPPVGVP